MGYDVAQICLNGHIINERAKGVPVHNKNFCDKCGKETITKCEKCGAEIRGYHRVPNVISISSEPMEIPKFCHNCGEMYPWTKSKFQALSEVVDLMEELEEIEKEELKQASELISTDNPKTQVGVLKIKKYLDKVSDTMGDVAKNLIVEIASEIAIKYMKEIGIIP